MSAIDELMSARALLITDISYTLNAPLSDPAVYSTGPICVPKSEPLAFTLTAEQLRLPIPGLNFHFNGTANAPGTQVTWGVDEPLDVWYSGVHITHVRGHLVTALSEVPPSLVTGCDGSSLMARLALATIGSDNTVTVSIALIGDATLTGVTASAAAAEAVPAVLFRVEVEADGAEGDGCGANVLLAGSTVRFTALLSYLHTVGSVTGISYAWSVTGAGTIVGGTDGQVLTVSTGTTGQVRVSVEVRVQTDVHSGTFTGRAGFDVLTEEQLEARRMWCRFRARLGSLQRRPARTVRGVGAGATVDGVRWVDPLWDPTPDQLRGVFSYKLGLLRDEIGTIHSRIASFDTLSFQVKGWAATLWAGLAGYAVSQDKPAVVLATIPLMLTFWALDSFFKSYQHRVRARMGVIEDYLNRSAQAPEPSLAKAFDERSFGEFPVYDPMSNRTLQQSDAAFKQRFTRKVSVFRAARMSNVHLVYTSLMLSAAVIFLLLR